MWTKRDDEVALEAAIRAWAHTIGVDDERPVTVAIEKAEAAYRRGATVAEAAGVARGFVLCWQRHPANGRRWADAVVA